MNGAAKYDYNDAMNIRTNWEEARWVRGFICQLGRFNAGGRVLFITVAFRFGPYLVALVLCALGYHLFCVGRKKKRLRANNIGDL